MVGYNYDMELVCVMDLCWLEKHDFGLVKA